MPMMGDPLRVALSSSCNCIDTVLNLRSERRQTQRCLPPCPVTNDIKINGQTFSGNRIPSSLNPGWAEWRISFPTRLLILPIADIFATGSPTPIVQTIEIELDRGLPNQRECGFTEVQYGAISIRG